MSVSYTHLDVYKRQTPHICASHQPTISLLTQSSTNRNGTCSSMQCSKNIFVCSLGNARSDARYFPSRATVSNIFQYESKYFKSGAIKHTFFNLIFSLIPVYLFYADKKNRHRQKIHADIPISSANIQQFTNCKNIPL